MNVRDFGMGVLLGAGLMYLLDPDGGRRRRALARDKVVRGGHLLEEVGERAAASGRHLRNRASGAVHEIRSRIRPEDVDDSVLEARVRSALGRAVSNPGAIEVSAAGGRVTLSGPVLESEASQLLATVRGVRGVHEVENALEAHASPGNVPGLQAARDALFNGG